MSQINKEKQNDNVNNIKNHLQKQIKKSKEERLLLAVILGILFSKF